VLDASHLGRGGPEVTDIEKAEKEGRAIPKSAMKR